MQYFLDFAGYLPCLLYLVDQCLQLCWNYLYYLQMNFVYSFEFFQAKKEHVMVIFAYED